MADLIKSKQQTEKDDMAQAQRIKPLLGNFVAKQQYDKAEENAHKNKAIADEKLSMEEIKLQCVRLSMRAYFDAKFWVKYPAPIEMAWITGKTSDGRKMTAEELESERNLDISGFSSYLLDEYYNNRKEISIGTYLHPLNEKNLEWFWQKFIKDLQVTLEIDRRRQAMGNQGVVIIDDNNS